MKEKEDDEADHYNIPYTFSWITSTLCKKEGDLSNTKGTSRKVAYTQQEEMAK